MIIEFFSEIGFIVFILAFIGYIAKYFYNVGYYRYAYNPLSQKSSERLLNYISFGIILVLLGILFFATSIGADKLNIPESLNNISVSTETSNEIMLFSYLLAIFIVFMLYISGFSLFLGLFMSYGSTRAVILKTNDSIQPEICVREISLLMGNFVQRPQTYEV